MRKSAKESDEKNGGGGDAGGVDDFDLTANDPTLGTGPSVGTRNNKKQKSESRVALGCFKFLFRASP